MLALSPSLFAWPLEDLMSHEQSGINIRDQVETNSDQSFFHSQSSPFRGNSDELIKRLGEVDGGASLMAKKLNHNATERDRRKRTNDMYSSLRSLLPINDRDHKKKLSIPSTITRVLKYIPELQRELEKLIQKQEELIKRKINNSRKESKLENNQVLNQRRIGTGSSLLSEVSVSALGDDELVIQLCTEKGSKENIRVSEILGNLEEEDRLLLLNLSSFESFGGRVFYNLHLQVQGTRGPSLEILRKKLLALTQ